MMIQTSTYPVEAYGRRGMDRGYLRFNPRVTVVKWYHEQGNSDPTVRGRIRKTALSLYRPCAELGAELKSYFVGPSREARALSRYAAEISKTREHISLVMVSLMAPANDIKARAIIAQRLSTLSDLTHGRLEYLLQGRAYLHHYIAGLYDPQRIALRNGVLGSPRARQAVLDQIPEGRLRKGAAELLVQIEKALKQGEPCRVAATWNQPQLSQETMSALYGPWWR